MGIYGSVEEGHSVQAAGETKRKLPLEQVFWLFLLSLGLLSSPASSLRCVLLLKGSE